MKSTADELQGVIRERLPALNNIPEEVYRVKPAPGKWSKKEILGHLVDSAQSNIRRFIIAQYEDNPLIKYNQDRWVALVGYQQWDTKDIINLWHALNLEICYILRNTSEEMYQRTCQTDAPHTIEWLAVDYIKHLKHHLHVILDLEPVAYP